MRVEQSSQIVKTPKLYPRPRRYPRPKYYPFPKKPKNRSECMNGIRPCPFVSCRYHLYMDIVYGKIKTYSNVPIVMNETCALDVAGNGKGMNLDELSLHFNLTRERVRQIIENSLRKIRSRRFYMDNCMNLN